MITWVEPLVLLLATAGALRVETATPDALCPELGEVRRAVQARLGDIEGRGEWLASYALVHRPEADAGDVVRLELRDPDGRLRLRRDLPRAGASCKAVAQVLVVVLDSYFRRPNDSPEPAAAEPSEVRSPRPNPVVPVITSTEVGPAPAPAVNPGLDLLGGWAGGPSSAALALEAWLSGRSGWSARLQGAWMLARPTTTIAGASSGTATILRSATLRASLASRFRLADRLELVAGPEALLVIDQVGTSGIPDAKSNTRAAWGVGIAGRLRVRLAPRVALALAVAGDFTPRAWGGVFAVERSSGEVFPSPRLRVFVGAGLSLALFQ